jgi:hypothetical protein
MRIPGVGKGHAREVRTLSRGVGSGSASDESEDSDVELHDVSMWIL